MNSILDEINKLTQKANLYSGLDTFLAMKNIASFGDSFNNAMTNPADFEFRPGQTAKVTITENREGVGNAKINDIDGLVAPTNTIQEMADNIMDTIVEKDLAIDEKEQVIGEKEQAINELQGNIDEKDEKINTLTTASIDNQFKSFVGPLSHALVVGPNDDGVFVVPRTSPRVLNSLLGQTYIKPRKTIARTRANQILSDMGSGKRKPILELESGHTIYLLDKLSADDLKIAKKMYVSNANKPNLILPTRPVWPSSFSNAALDKDASDIAAKALSEKEQLEDQTQLQ